MTSGTALFIALAATSTAFQSEEQEFFEEERAAIELNAVLDFRFIRTDRTPTWWDSGLGKARYGGDTIAAENGSLFRVPQASFVLKTNPARALSTHLHFNLDAEPENAVGRYGWDRLRLIEAFAEWRVGGWDPLELRLKGGLFFPPISLEHVGEAWSTFYTVTPSALNAWVGEEVRATGVEATLAYTGLSSEFAVRGAAFWNNDPTGSLLAYRGFSMHDRQVGFRDRVPLAPIPSLERGGIFAQQAEYVEPIVEIDTRPGYYGSVSWENSQYLQLNALYFDNRGTPNDFDGDQYAWKTRFENVGGVLFLPAEIELLGQFMDGDTVMGFLTPGGKRVAADFRTWYVMGSIPLGRQRFSLRYDDFRTRDRDDFREPDPSDEDGSAWTFAYLVRLAGQHRAALELMRIESRRPARLSIGDPADATELLIQLSLRLTF